MISCSLSEEQTPRRAVVIFARSPEDERRAKPLAERPGGAGAQTETLHRVLIERTLAAAGTLEAADVLLVTTGNLERACDLALRHVPPARLQVLPQVGQSFGERFENAVALAFDAGYHYVVAVGSDTPEFDAVALERAFDSLAAARSAVRAAVLGPSLDGGYYLLGLSSFSRVPFVDIAFGGAQVAADTTAALQQAGYTVDLLTPLPDIDDLQGVRRVATRLSVRRHMRPRSDAGDVRLLAALLAVFSAILIFPAMETPLVLSGDELRPFGPRGPPAYSRHA